MVQFGIAIPSAMQIAAGYERLGISPEDLFPVAYELDVSLPDGPPGGRLEGFSCMRSRSEPGELGYLR